MKNSRNLLLIGLALLLSPIPACTQMVCDINCSLESAGAHDFKTTNEKAGEGQSASEKHSRGTHCDEETLAASSESLPGTGSARIVKNLCRGDNCASDLGLNVSAALQTPSLSVWAFLPGSVDSIFVPASQGAG